MDVLPAMPARIVHNVNTAPEAEPVECVSGSHLHRPGLTVVQERKAVKRKPGNAVQKQKKEQGVPVMQGLVVIAGNMADKPWERVSSP